MYLCAEIMFVKDNTPQSEMSLRSLNKGMVIDKLQNLNKEIKMNPYLYMKV